MNIAVCSRTNGKFLDRMTKLQMAVKNKKIALMLEREDAIKGVVSKLIDLSCGKYVPKPKFGSWVRDVDEYAIGAARIGVCEDCIQRTHVMETNEGHFLCNGCLDMRETGDTRTVYLVTGFTGITKVVDKEKKASLLDEIMAAIIFSISGDQSSLKVSLEQWIRNRPTLLRKHALHWLATMSLQNALAEDVRIQGTEKILSRISEKMGLRKDSKNLFATFQ